MVPLAGAEEIGMNMTVYSYEFPNGEKYNLLVDCGVAFENMPGAGVVMPDIAALKNDGLHIDAIVLTHGHEDHIGAIPYLYEIIKAPMYATPFTVGLIEKKMKYAKLKDYQLDTVKCGDSRKIGPFDIQWIGVTHSIPDSSMLAIEVGGIRVLHTGDWKLDPDPVVGQVSDAAALEAFGRKGVHAMVSDSTNIHEEETARSEGEVAASLKKLVAETKKGRFVLTCFASNIARVKSCIDAARAAGRKVLILGSSLKKSLEVAVDLNYVNDDIVVTEEDIVNLDIDRDQLMIVCTGSQGEINSALWKMTTKSKLAGSVLEMGDTVIFSARVIDGRQHDVRGIINQLVERGIRVMHPWNSRSSCIHASGHPAQPDIKQLLDWVKPKFVIPVHSEAEHRVSHIAFAKSLGYKTFNLRNGVVIEITQDDIIKCETMKHGRLVYDGNRLVSSTSEIFKQRKEMNDNGILIISVSSKNNKLGCVVTSYGVYDKSVDVHHKKNITLNKQLRFDIERVLNGFTTKEMSSQENEIRKQVINAARNSAWNHIKKNPIIGCHIV